MPLLIMNIFRPWYSSELEIYWPILMQGMLVSVALGLIGCFLVVRGLSLLGDALSHAVLPGIVIGFLIGRSLHSPWILIGASIMGLLAAVLVQVVRDHSRVKEDASLGIVFTTLFAIGVVLINLYAGQADLDANCVLYGNIEEFISKPRAIWPMAMILGGMLIGLVVFYRHLLIVTFDPGLAISLGFAAAIVHYALMGVLSLTIVASFEAVGAILAVALLVMPGATARLWTDRMPLMLLLSAGHGIIATLLGYWISHEAVVNTSAGGAICSAGFGLFILSWLLSPHRGLIVRAVNRRRLNRTIETENILRTLEEQAGGLGLSMPSLAGDLQLSLWRLQSALKRGTDKGWIEQTGEIIRLTDAGRARGAQLRRAHELWEQYLLREVGLNRDHVHDPAEWIEHYLSDEKVERLDQLLAQPTAQ